MTTAALPGSLDELVRLFKPGYELERTSGHYRVRGPDGELVQYQGKNLTLSGTGKSDAIVRMRTALERSGVLKPRERRRAPRLTDEHERARKEALRNAMAARAQNRQREANALAERLDAVLHNVIDPSMTGVSADLAQVAVMVSRRNGATSITPDRAYHSAQRLLQRQWVTPPYQKLWAALAAELEAADDVVERWFDLVREARGLPLERVTVSKPVEGDWPFRVELLPLEALVVDHDYQRPVPWPFVRRLSATFDESQVGTIDVSERRPGAVFAILDGQLRFEACRLVGKTTIWASIYGGLTKSDEARFFLKKNRDRKAIHPYYVFKARLAAEDAAAVEIEETVREVGYKLTPSSVKGSGNPDNISAIASVEDVFERRRPDGSSALRPVLETLRASTYQREQGLNAVLIRGLGYIFAAFDDEQLERRRLEEVIARNGPLFLIGRARDLYTSPDHSASGKNMGAKVARVILTDYNAGRRGAEVLRLPRRSW